MSSSAISDSRVPTFIQYDTENDDKKIKRKRTVEPSTKKQRTKRSKKDQATPGNGVVDNFVNIWVGAAVKNKLGAYSIYFGENDNRNTTQVFQIEDVPQDEDYVSVMGALSALEKSQKINKAIHLYTSYRDLPRVSSGKRGTVIYPDLIEKIKTLINDKKEGVNVLYASGRNASPELTTSVELAKAALTKETEEEIAQNEENPVTPEELSQEVVLEEMIVETATTEEDAPIDEAIVEEVAVKSQETIVENNHVNEEEEIVSMKYVNGVEKEEEHQTETLDEKNAVDASDDTIVEAPIVDAEETTVTKVTTTVIEETVEIIKEPVDTVMREVSSLSEMDEDLSNGKSQSEPDTQPSSDDLIEEDETAPSSWSLGIRNVWDLLTSPFKSRK